jgi:phage-related protein
VAELFTWVPKIESAKETTYRVMRAQFGDGYRQQVKDGLNNAGRTWSLSFTGTAAYIDAIEAFLDTRGGEPFLWAPPGKPVALYTCEAQSRTEHGLGRATISATFEIFNSP